MRPREKERLGTLHLAFIVRNDFHALSDVTKPVNGMSRKGRSVKTHSSIPCSKQYRAK
jgi:hypothetical protein